MENVSAVLMLHQCRISRSNKYNFMKNLLEAIGTFCAMCVHSPKDRVECLGAIVPIKGGALEWGKFLLWFPLGFLLSERNENAPSLAA